MIQRDFALRLEEGYNVLYPFPTPASANARGVGGMVFGVLRVNTLLKKPDFYILIKISLAAILNFQ